MLGTAEEYSISNQQKIQSLHHILKKADTLTPKQTSNSRNMPYKSSMPIEDAFNQPAKHFTRTGLNPNQTHFPLEIRFSEIEDKVSLRVEHEFRILENTEMDIQSLQEEVRMAKKDVDKSKNHWEERAISIQNQANQDVIELTEQIKTLRKDLIDSIGKKYRTIKEQTMIVLGNHFSSGWEQAKEEIQSKIEDINTKKESQEGAKDEAVNFMVNSFGEQIIKLQQMAQREKEERSQSHHRVMMNLQRMEQDISSLIVQERKEASQGISQLQSCLEELCFKIQNYLLR